MQWKSVEVLLKLRFCQRQVFYPLTPRILFWEN
jgi:hypothetical protein